jgi:DNA polymerase III subunit beta
VARAVVEKEAAVGTGLDFTVERAALLAALERVAPVAETPSAIPILACALMEVAGGCVLLSTTDLEIGARTSCPVSGCAREGRIALPVKRLRDWLRLVPEGELHIRQRGLEAELLRADSVARISGMAPENFPELPAEPLPFASIPAAVLAEAIAATVFSISSEESRFTVNGALFLFREDGFAAVATDGARLSLFEKTLALPGANVRFLLPVRAMKTLAAQLAAYTGNVPLAMNENYIFASFAESLFIARKLTGNFPDYERVLPHKGEPESFCIKASVLTSAVARALPFADLGSRLVRLKIAPDQLVVAGATPETGSSEEKLRVDYWGMETEIPLNGNYLLDGLRFAGEREVEFRFTNSHEKIELRFSDDVSSFRYFVMPMRVS